MGSFTLRALGKKVRLQTTTEKKHFFIFNVPFFITDGACQLGLTGTRHAEYFAYTLFFLKLCAQNIFLMVESNALFRAGLNLLSYPQSYYDAIKLVKEE